MYKVNKRSLKNGIAVSTTIKKGGVQVRSSEKVIPLVVEYNTKGECRLVPSKEILDGYVMHPYKPNSPQFNEERLEDLEVAGIYKLLEHFPTMPEVDGEPHPVAEYIYSYMVYLKPTPKVEKELKSLDYIGKSKYLPPILKIVAENFHKQYGVKLDLFSVPKRKVGTFCFLAGEDGIGKVPKEFAFGFEKAIPADRLARELSSLKNCEKFTNPANLPFSVKESLAPFITMLRVAIVATEVSMLDGGDLFPSAMSKIACELKRTKTVKNLSEVEKSKRNLTYKPFRAGIEIVHTEEEIVDEMDVDPGAIRLIFPGGVKIAAQKQETQGKTLDGEDVDILLDFRTFASKGALACFAMLDSTNYNKGLDLEDCKKIFLNLETEKVIINDREFDAYVGYLPVMRPGQRYTELSKASNKISFDLVSRAILGKNYTVSQQTEEEYSKLVQLRQQITNGKS